MSLTGRLFLAAALFCAAPTLHAATTATDAPEVPQPFCVCVVTADAGGFARVDSCVSDEWDAKARRLAILTVDLTWTTGIPLPDEVTEGDREYEYPRASIVKAYVDPTLVNESVCMPPSTAKRFDADTDAGLGGIVRAPADGSDTNRGDVRRQR